MSKDADMVEGQEVLRVTVTLLLSDLTRQVCEGTETVLVANGPKRESGYSLSIGHGRGGKGDSGFWGRVVASTLEVSSSFR